MRMRIAVLVLAVFAMPIAFGQTTSAQPTGNRLVGEWEGFVEHGEMKMQVLLHVNRAEGGLTATADSVSEDEFGIPISAITLQRSAVYFAALDGTFDGTMSADGNTITGTWKQGGQSLPLLLQRITAERAAQIAGSVPKKINVAFVISDNFNMIDFAGPWEVFGDVMRHVGGHMQHPLRTYTVAAESKPVSSGGAVVVPQYTFANAPQPDIVVIPAQSGSPVLLEWLRQQNARNTTIMSVCTGASILAKSGLIDGHAATSHHEALDYFVKTYPKIQWQRSQRWVRSTDTIYTAGGLTSGIDLALHIVEVKFGRELAQSTADYLEYKGTGWKQPASDVSATVSPNGASHEGTASTVVRREGATDLGSVNTKVRVEQ